MRAVVLLFAAGLCACAFQACTVQTTTAPPPARNVILFLGDAGGIPTLNAASIHAYGNPRALYIHRMPHIALVETSAASQWVTDSAAGMTAIVTGRKTHNGVLAQSDAAVRGKQDGAPLKTILEYAEERGLSTGVISNSSVLSATPAALYAHVNDRGNVAAIFRNMLKPSFGDGVDVVIGAGRDDIEEAAKAAGTSPAAALKAAGYETADALEYVRPGARRVVVLLDSRFDLAAATRKAIEILSQNPKGYFLMVESDLHTEQLVRGLERTIALDRTIKETAERAGPDTLILFTADHSYDVRVHDGKRGASLLPPLDSNYGDDEDTIRLDNVRRDDDHTGEEVIAAATGPGASRVQGVMSNVDLFGVMQSAYGWK
ncbi:MAG: alkaline phosphatase [Vicinamibacterales bacterium]